MVFEKCSFYKSNKYLTKQNRYSIIYNNEVYIMLLTQSIPVVWNKYNRKRYESKGYVFTNYGDTFMLNVSDLTKGCDKRVDVKCDVCGEVRSLIWNKYLKQHDDKFGDTCIKCCIDKKEATTMENWGVKNPFQSDKIKQHIKQFYIDTYGVENPMHVSTIKEKQQQSTFNSFGVYNPSQSDVVKQKKIETCQKHFGVDNPMNDEQLRYKAVQKQRESYKQNGIKVSTSKTEQKMCDILIKMFGEQYCLPSFEVGIYTLDCMVNINDCKIDIEYDGQYWHTLDNQIYKDRVRDNYLIKQGYKILRVKGNRKIPTKEQLQEGIDYLVKDNHTYAEIILDI